MKRPDLITVAGVSTAGVVFGAILLGTVPASADDMTARLGCSKVVSLDEFARPSGTTAADLCVLPAGKSLRVVTISDRPAFMRYLSARPELVSAWSWPVAVIGTTEAMDIAGTRHDRR